MGRWEPNSRGRLQDAAFTLFSERGYDQTTTAEIAARAGLTERTFFRHFVDKREVLFGGYELLRAIIVEAINGAPSDLAPFDVVLVAIEAAANVLGEFRRDLARQRLEIIASNQELRERELAKLDEYAHAVAQALQGRGVAEPTARLAASAGASVLQYALELWTRQLDDRSLIEVVHDSVVDLRAALTITESSP
jgi:AcrR family transcriptional regulator